jgi:hypothetical protein
MILTYRFTFHFEFLMTCQLIAGTIAIIQAVLKNLGFPSMKRVPILQ